VSAGDAWCPGWSNSGYWCPRNDGARQTKPAGARMARAAFRSTLSKPSVKRP
jgi:hypothetical protein